MEVCMGGGQRKGRSRRGGQIDSRKGCTLKTRAPVPVEAVSTREKQASVIDSIFVRDSLIYSVNFKGKCLAPFTHFPLSSFSHGNSIILSPRRSHQTHQLHKQLFIQHSSFIFWHPLTQHIRQHRLLLVRFCLLLLLFLFQLPSLPSFFSFLSLLLWRVLSFKTKAAILLHKLSIFLPSVSSISHSSARSTMSCCRGRRSMPFVFLCISKKGVLSCKRKAVILLESPFSSLLSSSLSSPFSAFLNKCASSSDDAKRCASSLTAPP